MYLPRRPAASVFVPVRGLRYHLHVWNAATADAPSRPPLVMLHGWMDVGASFQFVVDALGDDRAVVAPDWRGFGLTDLPAGTDTAWFPDYLADLDALLDARWPDRPVDLLGHSMGGNVAMLYAGVRPSRVRRLVNLEGFGMPAVRADTAPRRYAQWLDQLKSPNAPRDFESLAAVAARLQATNPRLPDERATWLAAQWSAELPAEEGVPAARRLLAHPAHRRVHPVLWRRDEAIACWQRIAAPLLWVDGAESDLPHRWGAAWPAGELDARLAVVAKVERHTLAGAGHMLHHDRPDALARLLEDFLQNDDGPGG